MSANKLLFDQANLTISKETPSILYLWAQAVECYKCDLLKTLTIANDTGSVVLQTDRSWNLQIRDKRNDTICSANKVSFGEHGFYAWNVTDTECSVIHTTVEPFNELESIIYVLGIFISLSVIAKLITVIHRTRARASAYARAQLESESIDSNDLNRLMMSRPARQEEVCNRIHSLDAFRGIAIAMMIFVNYGGGEYKIFKHSPWNGLTIADLVFPWFAWIMGVGTAFKLKFQIRDSLSLSKITNNIRLRAFTLIILGLIVSNLGHADVRMLRLPGVLQRLAIAYFISASIESQYMQAQSTMGTLNERYLVVEDFLESYTQWALITGIAIIHTLITFLKSVPGCPTGYLGPGGLHDHSSHSNCTGGVADYIDKWVLTSEHMYKRATCNSIYKCDEPFDPEGILGTLTTVLCIYLGIHAGRIVLVFRRHRQRMLRWLAWSLLTGLVGGMLCGFSIEDGWIPINKNLWSLSYVLVCGGSSFFILTILYYVIDDQEWWDGAPFVQAGKNSIVLYVGHEITRNIFPWQWTPLFDESTHLEFLIMDIWGTVLWIIIAIVLSMKKVYLRI